MSRSLLLILVGLGGIVVDDASHSLFAQNSYPRVYGPTGRPYGPTQSHYQYERQYGRPWPGGPSQINPNTGLNFQFQVGGWGGYPYGAFYGGTVPYVNGFGYGYHQSGVPGWGGYGLQRYNGVAIYPAQPAWGGVQPSLAPPLPMVPQQFGPVPMFSWQQPGAWAGNLNRNQPDNPGIPQREIPQADPQRGNPGGEMVGIPEPVMQRPHQFMPPAPTTVAQRQRSLHFQGQGDVWFRQQNYLQAYSRYKQAAAAAADLAAPRFRMAYALIALRRFDLAVPEMQRGIQLDPAYPVSGESPLNIYGEENRLAAIGLTQSVTAWVKQDIRSPDRLFLMGALLMINGDVERARVLLETASEFGGPNQSIAAFLRAGRSEPANSPPPVPVTDDRPPVPESVEELLEKEDWAPVKPRSGRPVPNTVQPIPPAVPRRQSIANPPVGPQVPRTLPATPQTPAPAGQGDNSPVGPAGPKFEPIPKKGTSAPSGETGPSGSGQSGDSTDDDVALPNETVPASNESEQAIDTPPAADSGPVIPIP